MKRKALALLCAGILAAGMLAGCGGSSDSKDSSAKTEESKTEKKSDGTFTVALNYMPTSLEPSTALRFRHPGAEGKVAAPADRAEGRRQDRCIRPDRAERRY